jgi:single-stranded-DNA-specific exonuclease
MEWKEKKFNEKRFKSLTKSGLYSVFAKILSNRDVGVNKKKDITRFIACPLEDLEDPIILSDVNIARDLIIKGKGNALVYGDYDVDGITSGYLSYKLLKDCGYRNVDVYLPHRELDGYGLSETSISNLHARHSGDYDIMFVVDCGSSSFNEIEKLKELYGCPIIVIDHHIIEPDRHSTNADALINPRVNDCTPYCTAGLIFQLANYISRKKRLDIMEYLPYAAIGTVTDVCDLVGSNRVIVKNGLKSISACDDVGLNAILKVAEIDKEDFDEKHIGFGIGPMMNASGRLKVAQTALEMLLCQDEEVALQMAKDLKTLNERRKEIQNQTYEEAVKKVNEKGFENSILVWGETWNPGIVGIVASKLMEKFRVPVLCFGKLGDKIKGSARSIDGIHIKKVMDNCSEIFEKYGGHEMAAGATLKAEFAETGSEHLEQAIIEYRASNDIPEPSVSYDVVADIKYLSRLNEDMCERIMSLGPFGSENPTVKFLAEGIECKNVRMWKSGKGGFITLKNIDLICCAMNKNAKAMEGQRVDVIFSIQKCFMDKHKWMLSIEKARFSKKI